MICLVPLLSQIMCIEPSLTGFWALVRDLVTGVMILGTCGNYSGVLVCIQVTAGQEQGGPKYICELCSDEKIAFSPRRHLDFQQSEGRILSREAGAPLSESLGKIM